MNVILERHGLLTSLVQIVQQYIGRNRVIIFNGKSTLLSYDSTRDIWIVVKLQHYGDWKDKHDDLIKYYALDGCGIWPPNGAFDVPFFEGKLSGKRSHLQVYLPPLSSSVEVKTDETWVLNWKSCPDLDGKVFFDGYNDQPFLVSCNSAIPEFGLRNKLGGVTVGIYRHFLQKCVIRTFNMRINKTWAVKETTPKLPVTLTESSLIVYLNHVIVVGSTLRHTRGDSTRIIPHQTIYAFHIKPDATLETIPETDFILPLPCPIRARLLILDGYLHIIGYESVGYYSPTTHYFYRWNHNLKQWISLNTNGVSSIESIHVIA
jgi:hypothetical protein